MTLFIGDGFAGNLTASFEKLKFSASGKAIFGKKDFRYWAVDIWVTKTEQKGKTKLPIQAFCWGHFT